MSVTGVSPGQSRSRGAVYRLMLARLVSLVKSAPAVTAPKRHMTSGAPTAASSL